MKIKNKKMILGTFGTMAMISLPLATVISCGQKETESHYVEEYSLTINKKTVAKDGWGNKNKKITESVTDAYGKAKNVLSEDFSDYVFKKVQETNLKEDHKIAYIDLRDFGLDGLGENFIGKMKNIQIEKKRYSIKSKDGEKSGTIRGTSGILLNIENNNFTKAFANTTSTSYDEKDFKNEMEKMMEQTESIRGVIYAKKESGYIELDHYVDWMKWTLDKQNPGLAANWKIRYV
ncbi:hypothetical protein [Mycoplasma todarodis]|uniref:hypothetical protein n=1 Tax=Mycoplasma todarodis TaxID=1937191 RepID=UPI003B29ED8B